jgi:hypothetical protein
MTWWLSNIASIYLYTGRTACWTSITLQMITRPISMSSNLIITGITNIPRHRLCVEVRRRRRRADERCVPIARIAIVLRIRGTVSML